MDVDLHVVRRLLHRMLFNVEARFPETAKEVPAVAVEYVAQQVKVPAGAGAPPRP